MKVTLAEKKPFDHSLLKLEDRLRIEAIRRTNNGSLPQILLVSISAIFITPTSQQPWLFIAGFAAIILIQGLRYLMISPLQKKRNFEKLLKHFNFYFFLTFLTAITWIGLALIAFQEFGIASAQSIVFMLNIAGYVAGLSYSFASVPRLQKMFVVLGGLPLPLCAIIQQTPLWGAIVGIFVAYNVYLFVISRNHSLDLLYTYRTESELRAEREKLRMVINSVPGFVAVADGQGNWIEMSPSFQTLKHVPALQKAVLDFRQSHSESFVSEMDWVHEGQENSYVVSLARLAHTENSIIISGTPINELKAIRREMEAQRSKMEYSARLSTIGEMAGGVAHEINNPLAIIVGLTFQMQTILEAEDFPKKSSLKESIRKVESTALRISSIVQSLQYFAREGNSDPFEQTPVTMIVQNTLNLVQQKFLQNKIEFGVDPVPDVSIPARAVQIGQVLINLLNNAFDAVSNSPEKKIELRFRQSEKGLTFAVTDSGPGLPLEMHERIFQPFFTTKEIGQGTGLGLSVSKGIVEDHQGTLTLLTSPGRTTFEFTVPWNRHS